MKIQINDIVKDATSEEIALYEKGNEDSQKRKAEAEAKAAQKAALLDRLGITEEEAKLLLA